MSRAAGHQAPRPKPGIESDAIAMRDRLAGQFFWHLTVSIANYYSTALVDRV